MTPLAKWAVLAAATLVAAGASNAARADVVVFANQTDQPVRFTIVTEKGQSNAYQVVAGDVYPLGVGEPVAIVYESEGKNVHHVLRPNVCYYFFREAKRLDLVERSFFNDGGGNSNGNGGAPPDFGPLVTPGTRLADVFVIPVMILVDDDEPTVQRLWEKEFGQRMRQASAIMERTCRVRFEVAAVGTWDSDDAVNEFELSMAEFEREVRIRPPAKMAIGFTSQYRHTKGRTHMGGTRGPMYPYVFVREWAKHLSPAERLEILVHELGHVLGATHSAEPNSVMRPVVGDGKARLRSFRIGFDAPNTLAMWVFAEQLRGGKARSLHQFSPGARELLGRIYGELGKELPDDTASARYSEFVERASRLSQFTDRNTLAAAVRQVVRAMGLAAELNHGRAVPLKGDALTEFYLREAASEANKLPPTLRAKALLLALGVAFDSSGTLRDKPMFGQLWKQFESRDERKARLAVWGAPTMRGRDDLMRHFVLSASLTAAVGRRASVMIGASKETADAREGRGFSFADFAADLAGAEFASRLTAEQLALADLGKRFRVVDFLPRCDDLPEAISEKTFAATYGSTDDPRFRDEESALLRRIEALPGYAGGAGG